ncbi:MAG: EAL domain-containing protein [Lachnospiraceae bacterium]|nr:EAL domain-containing protein [Lachnospiraceae bacterium]
MDKRTILIVEDNELNREILAGFLEDTYQVLTAENGVQGLMMLGRYGASVALIILDIHMAVMDGYEFMQSLREDGTYIDIPIIVTTADSTEQIRCLKMGASDFVSKPYDPFILKQRVASLIRLKETSLMLHKVERDRDTGLYTRESFIEYVDRILKSDEDGIYDLICMEIDSFDLLLNDYGMDNCVSMVKKVASLLEAAVPKNSLMGRISEDKFAVFMKHAPVDEFRDCMEQCKAIPNQPPMPFTRLNFGVCSAVDHDADVPVILSNAIMSLVQLKGQYDKNVAEYDEEFQKKRARENFIAASAINAISEKQFRPRYQPKIDFRTGSIVGAEALVRWEHPDMGFMSPGEFIPVFEQNGFIYELDRYMVTTVCEDMKRWRKEGMTPVPVSLNISQLDFDQPDLASILENIVDSYELPHDLIHFEITESTRASNKRQIEETVRSLAKKGFVIELDDFGSGYSTLQILGEMPIHVIKLDQSIISNMTNPRYGMILRSIIYGTDRTGLRLVAEGVETKEQLNMLQKMCRKHTMLAIQGYYFYRPLVPAEFEALLKEA